MILVVGEHVGPYEILGRLGSGGMGLVFSAWDSRLHRDVAIKVLRDDLLNDESRERFLMEARTASSLNHANICTIFDIGEHEGTPYLVMELLKGETLRSAITHAPMSRREVLAVGCGVADALVAAHARGIIHRDIKPANIFLVAKPNGGWQPKVLDFGLAKVDLSEHLDPRYEITMQGATVGTVAYMSPEQARGEALDARSDLFALGIVLYEMATRTLPFLGATTALVFDSLLNDPAEPIRLHNPAFPPELEAVILRLLEKRLEDRYQSAADLLNAFHQVRDLLESQTAPGTAENVLRLPVPLPQEELSSPSKPSGISSGISQREPLAKGSSSSSEEILIRPLRREALPPLEVPLTPRHWTQARTFSPVGPSSSQAQRIASQPVSEIPKPIEPASQELLVHTEGELRTRKWGPALTLLIAAVAFLGFVIWRTQSSPTVPSGPVQLLLANIVNKSGDNALDGVVLEGFRFDMKQSTTIRLLGSRGPRAMEITTPEEAVSAGRMMGASHVLFGDVRRGGGPYTISIEVLNVSSGAAVLQGEENATSREEISNAIDRLSEQMRIGLGESGDDVRRQTVSLRRDASASVEALQAYVAGLAALSSGKVSDAIASFQHAVLIDPNFTQAWLRLASLYDREHAELAAIDAATHARDTDLDTSQRTKLLAEMGFALRGDGDLARAQTLADQFVQQFPQDQSTVAFRAELLRRQGRFSEAVVVAQNALARNAFDIDAAGQAELAMIALDRTDAAAEMERQSEARGQRHPHLQVLLSYWTASDGTAHEADPDDLLSRMYRAEALDATGQLSAGMAAWEAIAVTTRQSAATISAGAYGLARGSLDHALAGSCNSSTTLAHEAAAMPHGPEASFAIGAALGLCGDGSATRVAMDTLTVNYAQHTTVKNWMLPDLIAIDAMRTGDWQSAISTLQNIRQSDSISITPYLRGLAELGGRQTNAAIADLQNVLLHRGATTLSCATVYPMAQLAIARAYSANGDRNNAAAAYRSYLDMWKAADPGHSTLAEARRYAH